MSHDNEQISYEDYCKEIEEFEKSKRVKKSDIRAIIPYENNKNNDIETIKNEAVVGKIIQDSMLDILDWVFKGKKKNYRSDKW